MITTHTHENGLNTLSAMVEMTVAGLEGQALISQSHAVNQLLDLRSTTTSCSARQVIDQSLSDIRNLSAVETQFMRERAGEVRLAATVDEVFDHLELRIEPSA